jgi:hypothetical protein
MRITATPLTAALAGAFSALCWPYLWPLLASTAPSSGMWLVLGTVVCIALPAHAFVVGFGRSAAADPRTLDTALFKRIGAWLAAALVTAAAVAA